MPFRCGVIGYGRIGHLIGDILEGSSRFHVAGVADQRSSYQDLFASEVDCVAIATPPATHFQIAMDALQAGKDVFVEKPPCRTAAQARALADTAAAQGRVVFFAWHARYNPGVLAAKAYLRERQKLAIDVVYRENAADFHPNGSWVYEEGVIRDSGVNAFSVISDLVSETARIEAVSSRTEGGFREDAPTRASLQYTADGIPIAIEMDWTWTAKETRTFEILTEAGRCSIDITSGSFQVPWNTSPVSAASQFPPPGVDMLRCEYTTMLADWADHLDRRESLCGLREMNMLDQLAALAASRS